MGLQLEFVKNENLTEINIMMSGFDYSFASLTSPGALAGKGRGGSRLELLEAL